MIEFVAVKYFSLVYHTLLMLFVIMLYLDAQQTELDNSQNLDRKNTTGILLMLIVIIFLGLRPITHSHFGDMAAYNYDFEGYARGQTLDVSKDLGFELFIQASAQIMSAQFFFLICAFLYIYPLYLATKKLFKEYWYYAFFLLLASLSFWGYGTNGIRNGLATTFFIFAISREKTWLTMLFIALSVSFHGSLLIPAAAYFLTLYYKNTRHYIYFWLLAIPLSIALSGFWENFFFSLGFGDEQRLKGFLSEIGEIEEIETGFRWDFLLYSASGVFAGWYFVIKRQYEDALYVQLFNIYLVANAFWILVIRANYSNRFAYLSWFLLALIIVYPFLQRQFFDNQHKLLAKIFVIYFAFTYLLNVVFSKY